MQNDCACLTFAQSDSMCVWLLSTYSFWFPNLKQVQISIYNKITFPTFPTST